MNIHEFQGKKILKQFGVAIPSGAVAHTPEKAVEAAKQIGTETCCDSWAVKAQIHAGQHGSRGTEEIGVPMADTARIFAEGRFRLRGDFSHRKSHRQNKARSVAGYQAAGLILRMLFAP